MIEIRRLSAADVRANLEALADVLVDCVEGGASVSFMAPFSRAAAIQFFENALGQIESGHRILLAAFQDEKLVGTVQILTAMPPNQPHRAEVAKLLVLRSARGQGLGAHLMEQVEEYAREAGKSLLVLDTVTGGDGEKLYTRLGWVKAGVIPRYAMFPDGQWCDTTIFWKTVAIDSNEESDSPLA